MAELQEILIANLTLDTYRKNNIPPLVVPKGDYGARVVRVMITEQGKAVTVKERDAVYIVAERSGDGASEAFSGKVNKDGSVTVPITQWMLDIPVYDVICHVVVTGDGYQYSTNSFLIEPQSKENPTELSEDDPRKNVVDELLAKENENYDAVKNTFSNAIKGNVSGKIVAMDDVSPVEHKVPVKLRSKNLIPYPYYDTTKTEKGVTFTDNGDGTITLNGTATGNSRFDFLRGSNAYFPNGTYTLSGISGGSETKYYIQMFSGSNFYDSLSSGSMTVVTDGNLTMITLYVKTGATFNNLVIKPQLEVGTASTEYTPYVAENTQVAVKSFGKNLIPYPYKATTITKDGVTFTDNGDGSVTLNGTSTNTVSFVLCQEIPFFSSYTGVSGSNKVVKEGLCMSNRGVNTDKVGIAFEIWGGGIPTLIIFCNVGNTYNNAIVYPQIEVGDTPTEYELYKEGETVTTTISDGAELANIAPNMTISTDKEGVIVDAEYNKDANKVIEKLTQAIISLGGNV